MFTGLKTDHARLCVQGVKPKDFAMQINLSMENCWGIVRALVDVVAAMDDGKYLLVKCAAFWANTCTCMARCSIVCLVC